MEKFYYPQFVVFFPGYQLRIVAKTKLARNPWVLPTRYFITKIGYALYSYLAFLRGVLCSGGGDEAVVAAATFGKIHIWRPKLHSECKSRKRREVA